MRDARLLLIALVTLVAVIVSGDRAGSEELLYTLDTPTSGGVHFPQALAMGDVNGDGRVDIAAGSPFESTSPQGQQGRAYVFDGASGSVMRTLDVPGAQAGAWFGGSIAMGDVNSDSKADIAVGASGENVGPYFDQGRVYLFDGVGGGLIRIFDVPNPQSGAQFGRSLSMGDTNADGRADIVVASLEDVGANTDQGRVYLFDGASGLLIRTLNTPNPQAYSYFGGAGFNTTITTGDTNSDGRADIAVGAFGEDIGGVGSRGRAYLFDGASGALIRTLNSPNAQVIQFGMAVAMGDTGTDGAAEIAVGAPQGDTATAQGHVYVFDGATGNPTLTLLGPNPQGGAWFGNSLAMGDVDGDGDADIASGAFVEDVGTSPAQGRAYLLDGASGAALATLISPNAQQFGYFGVELATGDVNADGNEDVAVAATFEDVSSNSGQGRAYVFCHGVCEPLGDADGDGVANASDPCPGTPPGDIVDINGCSDGQVDLDGDGLCNPGAASGGPSGCAGSDPCPGTPPGDIVDINGCSDGQVDADGDGLCNPGAASGGPSGCAGSDNCPALSNVDQTNSDGDGFGDACDNCPLLASGNQTNSDADSRGDPCDNCYVVPNEDQANSDGDPAGDACDNCVTVPNSDQLNHDGDSAGDACDADDDNDTVPDLSDNCPLVSNPDQADSDGDGTGNVCGPDAHIDQMSIDLGAPGVAVGVEGNGKPAASDRDGDGVIDAEGYDTSAPGDVPGVCGNGLDDDPGDLDGNPATADYIYDGVADDGCQVTLTPLETCAEVIDDGILNADEDLLISGQDIALVDVTLGQQPGTAPGVWGGIPASRPIHAWQFDLNWTPNLINLRSPQQLNFLINTNGAASPFTNASAALPDLNSPWTAAVSDAGPLDYGSGVLNRIRVEGDTAGLATLTLSSDAFLDQTSDLIPVDLLNSAQIAVSKDGPDAGTMIGDSLGERFLCPGPGNPDDDGDGVYDLAEENCGSDPLNTALRPERLDTPVDDDGDTAVNEPLPAGSEGFDCDGDGWLGSDEMGIYATAATANDQDPCGNTGWPSDLVGTNSALNIADINSFLTPLRPDGTFNKFGHTVPDPADPNIGRWNLRQPPNGVIDIADLNRLNPGVNTTIARPPMFGGQQAFFANGGVCPWPP